MSDRGSILISTANDIGEALVEKLGGEGYAPSVWDKEYNKLGIAEVDSAPALSVLEDSSETGTARGSILLSTANKIGAVLNKKYNTDRGFKPKEWASAASKLAPLPQKSAESASICAIEDGADDVPTKSLIVTIPPTLSGVSSVTETQTGKNLLPKLTPGTYGTNGVTFVVDSDGVVTMSGTTNASGNVATIPLEMDFVVTEEIVNNFKFHLNNSALNPQFPPVFEDDSHISAITPYASPVNNVVSFSASSIGKTITQCRIWLASGITVSGTFAPAIMMQSTATPYEPYQTPTTYTANLGRTIYGGQADIVNGGGQETHQEIDLGSLTWIYASASNRFYANLHLSGIYTNFPTNANELADITCADYETITFSSLSGDSSLNNKVAGVTTDAPFLTIRDTRFSNATDFKNAVTGKKAVIPLATTIDFTFDGQEINTRLGYNAFWSDQGNTALDYYGEPEPYTRGTASGAIANVQSARTDLPFTQVKANIAPNLTGVSEVKVFNTGAGLVTVPDVSGSITNAYFYNISTGFTLTAGVTYKITMVVNSTVTTFAVSVGVGDDSAYRYDIYNTGIINKNGVVSFEFTPEASHLTTWDKLWIRAPRYSDPSGSQQTTCTFTVTNILLYTSEPAVYTADLGEPINGGSVDFVSGEVKEYPYSDLGTRSIFRDPNRTGVFYCALPGRVSGSDVLGCNKYAVLNIAVSTSYDKYVSGVNSYGGGYIFFRDTSLAGLTDAELTEALTGTLVSFDNGNIVTRSIPGQVIVPSEGVNNLWNNAGGDTEVEYFEQE